MKSIKTLLKPSQKAKTATSTALLAGFCAVDAYAQIPTMKGPGSAESANDPFLLIKEIFKWGITIIGYGICALVFLTVVKNVWAKYNDMGEDGSRTSWRDVLTHGIGGMAIVIVGVLLTNLAIGIFGEAAL